MKEVERTAIAVPEAAAAHNAKAAVVCWDTARTVEKDQAAFERCVDYLFERISMNLEDRGSSAIIVDDKPGGGKNEEAGACQKFCVLSRLIKD